MQDLRELIKKIELQSILVLLLTLLFGYLLLCIDNTLLTPSGILGTISIGIGLLYTFIAFASNNTRESYKDVIAEYKQMVESLKSSNQESQKYLKDTLAHQKDSTNIGGYKTRDDSSTTQNN